MNIDIIPENTPIYKDSGLWQIRSDCMKRVIIQQNCNETTDMFFSRVEKYFSEFCTENKEIQTYEWELCGLCSFGNLDCTCGAMTNDHIYYADTPQDCCEHLNSGTDNEGFRVCEDCGVELP
jgi:hypothetical protein